MVPSWFLYGPKSIPFLPPTAASTIPSKLVGMFIKSIPLLNTEAIKPPISVTTPPPTLRTKSRLPKPYSVKAFHTCIQTSITLFSSPFGSNIISAFSRPGNVVIKYSKQASWVLLSTTIIILWFLYSESTSDKEEDNNEPISIIESLLSILTIH